MKAGIKCLTTSLAAVALAAGGLLMAPTAQADQLPSPDAVFQAWNNSFLEVNGGDTYYTTTPKSQGTVRARMWIGALDIQVAEDVYERTHAPADRKLVNDLVTTYIKDEGTTWEGWDTWNDDIAWDMIATMRGYQDTGNKVWLATVIDQWNKTYARGWTADGGGGIWEDNNAIPSRGKCALSNDPMASIAVWLYQATGDNAYLTKAKGIYAWVKQNIVTASTGVVNECITFPTGINGPTKVSNSDNAYNAGSYIEMADALYRATGDTMYRDDATRTADHFLNNIPVVANGQKQGSSYQYWLFKGISDLCTDAADCPKYDAYLRSNAARAWSMRDSADLTWNDWNHVTTEASPDAFMTNGMPALFQVLPVTETSPFSGNYTLQNLASKLPVSVSGDSAAGNAPVVGSTGSGSSAWAFVPGSNGYYELKNVHSGQVLNVLGASAASGAAIVQHPAAGLVPGSDQWRPVKNADGSYSFYNRNSQLALDQPAGAQFDQSTPNDSAAQKFTLTSAGGGTTTPPPPPVTPAPPISGTGAVKSGLAGKCLDLNADNTTNGTHVQLYTCNGTAAQAWTATTSNTLTLAGKCLDANAMGTADGTKIQLWDCNGGTNQIWQPHNGGYQNPASGKCLDDPASTTTDRTQLQLFDCNGTNAQKWSLPGA